MGTTTGDRRHARQTSRDVNFAGFIGSPSDHRAVAQQRQAVVFPRGNGNYFTESGWRTGLAKGIVTPGNHGTVRLQSKAVIHTTGYRNNVTQRFRNH